MNLKSSNSLMFDSAESSYIRLDITSIMFFFLIRMSLQLCSSCMGVCDSGLPMSLCAGEFPLPSFMIPLTRYLMKKSSMKSSIVKSKLSRTPPSYYLTITPRELNLGLTSGIEVDLIWAMFTLSLKILSQSLLGSALSYCISLLESLLTMIWNITFEKAGQLQWYYSSKVSKIGSKKFE